MIEQRRLTRTLALRVAFLSPVDSFDPDALSGMPHAMRRRLESCGCDVVPLQRPRPLRRVPSRFATACRDALPLSARESWREIRRRWSQRRAERSGRRYEHVQLELAKRRAVALSERIRIAEPDVIFGCCVSSMLYGLETDVPIVYFSDATARIINGTYPSYLRRGRGYKRVCDAYERDSMRRVAAAAFATQCARDSAVRDYGLDRQRSAVVPMGAHITPDDLAAPLDSMPTSLPTRADLRLCIVAADARRKRVAFAVQVVEALRQSGWNARLTHIGPSCPAVRGRAHVRPLGRLRLSSAVERRIAALALAESHLMLLPSIGEAYGIAPCEAAHFGRPSVVSAAGGLPEVVLHERTGLVLAANAEAEDYARSIVELAADQDRYRAMSQAARERAQGTLNWDEWARPMMEIIERAAGRSAAPPAEHAREPVLNTVSAAVALARA